VKRGPAVMFLSSKPPTASAVGGLFNSRVKAVHLADPTPWRSFGIALRPGGRPVLLDQAGASEEEGG